MAEFCFYGTWKDSLGWLEMLCEMRRFTFVESGWYTAPVPRQFTTIDDGCPEWLHKPAVLFLWSDSYSRFPPAFTDPNSDGQMRIDSDKGGPALNLWLPACFEYKGRLVEYRGRLSVGLGSLGYQPEYENPETGEWYKPPEALKQAYEELRALLRKSMVKRFAWGRRFTGRDFKPIIETYWLGRHAAQLLDEGKAEILLGHESVWKTGADLYKRKNEMPEPPEEE